jgi:hypothetical protein
MCQLAVPGEWSVKVFVTSDSTYWDVDTVHVHISLCRLMHGLAVKFEFREVNLALRYITLSNGLSLLQRLGSLLCVVQAIVRRVMGFISGVTIIINKKLCYID